MSTVNEVKRIIGQFIIESRYLYCFVVDKEGCVFYSNAAFNRFFKTNQAKLNGKPLKNLFAETHQEQVQELVSEVYSTGSRHKTDWVIHTSFDAVFHINLEINLLEVDNQTYAVGIIQDQTKEKKLEQSLNKQNEQLLSILHQSKLFIKTAQIGTWTINVERDELSYNDILLDIYEKKRTDLVGTGIWKEHIHPDDVADVEKTMNKLRGGEGFNELVFRIITPSGKTKYIQSSAVCIKNNAGQVIKCIGADLDITSQKIEEQRKIESAKQLERYSRILQLKNKQLELAVSTAELGIWSYNLANDKLVWNNRQFEIFEINPEDFERDNTLFKQRLHTDDLAKGEESFQRAIQGQFIDPYVIRVLSTNGDSKFIFGSMAPIFADNGTVEEVHGVNIDVTPLMNAQEARDQRETQLKNITDKLPGLVIQYVIDRDGSHYLNYVSEKVLSVWGITHHEATTNIESVFGLIVEEDLVRVQQSIQHSAETMTDWDCTYRILTPANELKHIRGMGVPNTDGNGAIIWNTLVLDITKQVQQDRALEKQRDIMNKLSNQVPGMVYIYQLFPNGADSIYYINNGVKDIFEIEADDVMQDASLLWGQIIDEDLNQTMNSIKHSMETLEQWETTFRIQTPSGVIKHIRATGTPHKLDDGTIQWYSMGSDITSLLKQQEELKAQKNLIQQIANQIPGVVIRIKVDVDGAPSVDYVSNGVEEMFGLTKNTVLADFSTIWLRHHPDDIDEIQKSMDEAVINNTQWVHIHRYFNANDEVKYMQGFGTPRKLADGSIEWSIITLDVTDRIEAEQKANETNTKLRAFINASPIAIYQIDPAGTVTDFWNPSAELIFGWERDYVIGKIAPFISDENKDSFFDVINDIETSHRPKQFPFPVTNRFGEKLQLDITAGPIFNEHGKLTDLLIIANDITELEDYRRTIEKALREKEILLQEIHHRVKNNLAIVSGLLELQALRDDSDADLSLIIEARNRIHSIAMVHEQLYRDMDFSHINPKDYYNKLLNKLQANTVSGTRNIEYDLKFEVERININQAVPLGLLINELFTNSVKYAFNSGQGKLRLHFIKEEDKITVHYADNGPGFNIEDVKDKNTIGWQLIITLLAQLDSEYTIDTDGKFDLRFTFAEVVKGSQMNYN